MPSMCFVTASAEEGEIGVFVDSAPVTFDQPPVIIDGRTLVPLRAIFEAMGATVDRDDATRTAIAQKDDVTVKITIDENVLYKNDAPIELDVPAQLISDRTMVPARAVSEAFGAYVNRNPEYRQVFIRIDDTPLYLYFDKESAVLIGMAISAGLSERLIGDPNLGAGYDIMVNISYDEGKIKALWDSYNNN